MKTAELLALTASTHVDLSHVGATASNTRGIAAQRVLTRVERQRRQERHEGIEVVPSAKGPETRSYRRPRFAIAECGQAAVGLDELPWYAARYSYAGDPTCYWPLWVALASQAIRQARREAWQPRVPGRFARDLDGNLEPSVRAQPHFYLLELAQLVLDVDGCPQPFVLDPERYALYMQVELDCWQRVLEPRYASLHGCYQRWLAIGRRSIQRWLGGAEEA